MFKDRSRASQRLSGVIDEISLMLDEISLILLFRVFAGVVREAPPAQD
jgi:hypothetical protein